MSNTWKKYRIEEGLNEEELLHAKIIRDADKTDIFKVNVNRIENDNETYKKFNEQTIKRELATPEVLEDFLQHKVIERAKIKNQIDYLILLIAFIYDYNFSKGLEIIKEHNYIERVLNILNECNETKNQAELIRNTAIEFLTRHTS